MYFGMRCLSTLRITEYDAEGNTYEIYWKIFGRLLQTPNAVCELKSGRKKLLIFYKILRIIILQVEIRCILV